MTAVLSALVFATAFYGWATVHRFIDGLTAADVIDPHAQNPTGEQNILLLGIDTRTDAQGNPLPQDLLHQLHAGSRDDGGDNTDTMIVVHVPADGRKATAISIPRDSYVEIDGGYGHHKINSAFTYGKNAARNALSTQEVSQQQLEIQSAEAGARTAIKTVERFTGLMINHYAAVNLAGFYYISQAIGGVPVCLKAPVHDSYSGASFAAGHQEVSGFQALAFVRQRHGLPNDDFDRIKRQQAFMASAAKKMLSWGTLADAAMLNKLSDAITKSIVIDHGWDILGLVHQLKEMSSGSIVFTTIPVLNANFHTPSDGEAFEVDSSQVHSFVNSVVTGTPYIPASPDPGTSATPSLAPPSNQRGPGTAEAGNTTATPDLTIKTTDAGACIN
jgi:LCP family protein required for cell wall assembly